MFRLCIALTLGIAAIQCVAADRVDFNRQVRPILSENCFQCHGPDPGQRKADLRLDIPNPWDRNAMVERIFSQDSESVMPPPHANKKISDTQRDVLKQWVEQGAEYETHWAFAPIARPAVPCDSELHSEHRVLVNNPIDAFVAAKLRSHEWTPAPPAAKISWIRRVTLDLIGLPPTPQEVQAFQDDQSEFSYESVVDRLLGSPHYGERMAVDWLDAARYADTNGYQVDRNRELWPWRDWVIRAFNSNMPFDQFTIEQLAGDLLPNATLEQKIATGFHRNHMLNEEGGIIDAEFLAEYTADRVETTAAVWMGQTFNCTRCHDHKYDPFTQRDFYAMKAFFHNVPERGVGIYANPVRRNAPPFVQLAAPEIQSKIQGLQEKLGLTIGQLDAFSKSMDADLAKWLQDVPTKLPPWQAVGQSLEIKPSQEKTQKAGATLQLPAGVVAALKLEVAPVLENASFRWNEISVTQGDKTLKVVEGVDRGSLAPNEVIKVVDANRKTNIDISVKKGSSIHAIVAFEQPLQLSDPTEIAIELGIESLDHEVTWRFATLEGPAEFLVSTQTANLASKPANERTANEQLQLQKAFLSHRAQYRELAASIESLKKAIQSAEDEIPTTLVMSEMETRKTFVLLRGAYDRPGEEVFAATPAVLPPLGDGLPRNRLGLASWLVDPAHPLTARVTVNRFWQQVFGTGLVRTSEDFGAQGELPSHPELLDFLANMFRESQWDVKRLMRMMVTSSTYRQHSQASHSWRELDGENRLLARGPRQRLMAEFIRDHALAVSGLLSTDIGGPSVRPYHPTGLYEQVTAGTGYNVYEPGTGKDLYRRSIYTYWKRSVPHPAMLAFDAPFREFCSMRRTQSNTPLQALNLMNDPTYVEAARGVGERMLREGGDSPESRIRYGFLLILSRYPTDRELQILSSTYRRALSDFDNDRTAATVLLSVGSSKLDPALDPIELAALTTIATTLLNLDEAISK
ncbi:MAG: PSD1 and planctomycete cytochrome C domain-containing protein [Pirellula sp.]